MRRLVLLAVFLVAFIPAVAAPYATITIREAPPEPKPKGELLFGIPINFTDKPGVGFGLGGQWELRKMSILLLGDISAVQLKGESGSAEFRRFCQVYQVPFALGDRTATEYRIAVWFKPKPR